MYDLPQSYQKIRLSWGLILGMFITTCAQAQMSQVDSLKAAIATATTDTTQCKLLEELIELLPLEEQYVYNQQLKRIAMAGYQGASQEVDRRHFMSLYSDALNNEGYAQMYTGHPDSALLPFQQCLMIDQWLQNANGVAASYNNIGYYYAQKGNGIQSLFHYQQAIAVAQSHSDTVSIAYTLGNIASMHEDQQNWDLALKNYRECLTINTLLRDSEGIGRAHNYIAHVFIKTAQYDSAFAHCALALETFSRKDLEGFAAATYGYLAFIYLKRQAYDRAQEGFAHCLEIYEDLGFDEGVAVTLMDRIPLWVALGQPQQAEHDALQAMAIGERLGLPDVVMQASRELSKLYAEKQDYRKAMEMQMQYTTLHDSMANRTVEKSLLRTQFQYEYTQKVVADSLQGLQERAIFDLQLAQQRSQKRWSFLIVGLVILFAAFILNRFRVTRRQKRQIEVANQDLSRQHLLNQKIFSVISHDFRGPILSLNLMLDALRAKKMDEGLQQFVAEVNTEVRNANEVLNNLLNWAKTEINLHDFQQGSAALQAIATEILTELAPKLRDKGLIVNHTYPADAKVALPPDILRIVLRNLLSNAVKFSHPGQAVDISYTPATQVLAVHDHGIGISPTKQAQLFRHEVDTALGTANEEGFGMGLYIVSELLHKYQHAITVVSTQATGTIFSVQPNPVASL